VGLSKCLPAIEVPDFEELRFKRTGKRKDIFLATKFGSRFETGRLMIDGRPEYVKQAFEKSMSHLAVDYVDLYYLHRADKTVPIEVCDVW